MRCIHEADKRSLASKQAMRVMPGGFITLRRFGLIIEVMAWKAALLRTWMHTCCLTGMGIYVLD